MKISIKNLTLALILMGTSCYASSSSSFYSDENGSSSSSSSHHPESGQEGYQKSNLTLTTQDGRFCVKITGSEDIIEYADPRFTQPLSNEQSLEDRLDITRDFFASRFGPFVNAFPEILKNNQFIDRLINDNTPVSGRPLETMCLIAQSINANGPLREFKEKLENFWSKREHEINLALTALQEEQRHAAAHRNADAIRHLKEQLAIAVRDGQESLAFELMNEIKYQENN